MTKRTAVIIGCNYQTPATAGVPSLSWAEADALAVQDSLRPDIPDVADIITLIGPRATEREIRRALLVASMGAGKEGLCIVYFSGHGMLDPYKSDRASLLPVDADVQYPGASAIPLHLLLSEYLFNAGQILLLLDCCHSGAALDGVRTTDEARAVALADLVGNAFGEAQGKMVIAACTANEVARERTGYGHGVLTHHLLQQWSVSETAGSLYENIVKGMQRVGDQMPLRGSKERGIITLHEATVLTSPGNADLPVFLVPYQQNPLFTGRDSVLAEIGNELGRHKAVAVIGSGGIGKTQLAVQYAYKQRGKYTGGIFWVSMTTPETMERTIGKCAGLNGLNLADWDTQPKEQKIAAIMAEWEKDTPRLLIFDDVNPEHYDRLAQWLPKVGRSQIWITSRHQPWPAHAGIGTVAVPHLHPAQAYELLLTPRALRRNTAVAELLSDPVTADTAKAICEALGYLPLALALAATYLESHDSMDLDRYWRRLQKRLLDDPSLKTVLVVPLPTGHEPNVAATIALSYDQLKPDAPQDALARLLFIQAGTHALEPTPRHILLQSTIPDQPPDMDELGEALQRLVDLGLLEALPGDTFRTHPLFAAFARSRISDIGASLALARAHGLLG